MAADRAIAPVRWPWLTGSALSLVGLAVASYLTYEHYTGSKSLSCPGGGGVIDCAKVTESIYNQIDGIPVVDLGLTFFVVMLILQSPWLWHRPEPAVRAIRIGWTLVGIGTAFKLVYDELYNLDAICLWCTSVHVITFILLVSTLFGTLATAPVDTELDESA
jgi:uncharacterized membrane protein